MLITNNGKGVLVVGNKRLTGSVEVRDLNKQLQCMLQQWQPNNLRGRLVSRQRSTWHEIAARQRERRKLAKQENEKLRKLLQIQVHEARNLRRVLNRRNNIDIMENMFGMNRHTLTTSCVAEDNPQAFDDMLQDMDEIYVGLDAFLLSKGLYDLPCPGRRRDAKRNITNGQFLELIQRYVLPFDIHTTEKAMWNVMRQIIFQELTQVEKFAPHIHFHSHHVEASNSTLKTSFRAEVANLGDVKCVQFRTVVRKYIEQNHVVSICKITLEPIVQKKWRTSGFMSRTTLRLVIHKEDSNAPRSGPLSYIDSHFSATRYDQGLPVSSSIRTPANLDLGIAFWDEAITRLVHQVESLVIDESAQTLKHSL